VAKRTYHLFLWDRENGMQDLGPVVNGDIDINDSGQIVGTMQDPNGHERAFIWDAEHGRRVLPTLGGETAIAHAINNQGQVVGEADTGGGLRHAFFWDSSLGVRDLTPASTQGTRAWSTNDAGEIIIFGGGGPALVDVNAGVVSTPRTIPVLGLIEINSHGYVAGLARAGPRTFDVGTWHPETGLKTIVQLNSGSPASARMNDVGQVAFAEGRRPGRKVFGLQFPPRPSRNYLHDPNLGRLSLNGYAHVGSWENLWLTDLNNHGCIVGAVQSTRKSSSVGVLLEPIPERWGK
jgi:probable HAF family extracellular repeat protein